MAQECKDGSKSTAVVCGVNDSTRALETCTPPLGPLPFSPHPSLPSAPLSQAPPSFSNAPSYGKAAEAVAEEAGSGACGAGVVEAVAAAVVDAVEVEVGAQTATVAGSAGVNPEQHGRMMQLQQMLRERRLARHRAKRLRRAIERMAQGDRVELYDLSFEEKAQVAVAGFVAVILAAPLVALLPRALRLTLLPAAALLALAFMLVAEIRGGAEQPPTPPPPPTLQQLSPLPLNTGAHQLGAVQPPLPSAASDFSPLRRPARLARPARAAIGPPYAIGGSRPKIVNPSTDRHPRSMASSSLTNTPTFLAKSPGIPPPSSFPNLRNYHHGSMNHRDSDDSLGLADFSYFDAPPLARTEIIDTDKCPFHEKEESNRSYEFPKETDVPGRSTDAPKWMPELQDNICPYRLSEHVLDIHIPVTRTPEDQNAEFGYSLKFPANS